MAAVRASTNLRASPASDGLGLLALRAAWQALGDTPRSCGGRPRPDALARRPFRRPRSSRRTRRRLLQGESTKQLLSRLRRHVQTPKPKGTTPARPKEVRPVPVEDQRDDPVARPASRREALPILLVQLDADHSADASPARRRVAR